MFLDVLLPCHTAWMCSCWFQCRNGGDDGEGCRQPKTPQPRTASISRASATDYFEVKLVERHTVTRKKIFLRTY